MRAREIHNLGSETNLLGGTALTKKTNLEIILNGKPNITRLPLWIGQRILAGLNQKLSPKEPNHRIIPLKVGKTK
jgi:hypothetical protein